MGKENCEMTKNDKKKMFYKEINEFKSECALAPCDPFMGSTVVFQ